MIEQEAKASLRSATADAVLEFRRTCDASDAGSLQGVVLDPMSSLVLDGALSVRVSALTAIGEACSSDSIEAASLLLDRCLDVSPRVRRMAVYLLVDEFRLPTRPRWRSVSLTVLRLNSVEGERTSRAGPPGTEGMGHRAGGAIGVKDGRPRVLEDMIGHYKKLLDTDEARFRLLVASLVEAVILDHGDMDEAEYGGGDLATGGHEARTPENNGDVLEAYGRRAPWEALTAPASRLSAACHPSHSVLYDTLDGIIADLFDQRTSLA